MKNNILNTELTPTEVKEILKHVIKTNLERGKQNKHSVAVCIEGKPGIAKTSSVEQLCEELGIEFVKENVAEKEAGDLLGFPQIEVKVNKKTLNSKDLSIVEKEEIQWIPKDTLSFYMEYKDRTTKYELLDETRMNFSKPEFIQGKEDKPIILILDDFSRSLPTMQNAIMNIVDRQHYSSWALAPGSTVILTANPDDDEDDNFAVNTLDSAQKTRYITLKMKACVNDWIRFAEKDGVDSRCINFIAANPHIFEGAATGFKSKSINSSHNDEEQEDKNNSSMHNPRVWTKFFHIIGGFESFKDNWDTILKIGQTSLPKEGLIAFYKFIEGGMTQIPSVEDVLLSKSKQDLEKTLQKFFYDKDSNKKLDIVSVFSKRLYAYCENNVKYISSKPFVISNLQTLLESDTITPDLLMLILKNNKISEIPDLITDTLAEKLIG